MTIATAVCANCCTRVDVSELANPEKKCDHCRGLSAMQVVHDDEPAAPVAMELFDEQPLDLGLHIQRCDET